MNFRTLTLFLWGSLIATAAIAGEERETVIKIAVDDEGGVQKEYSWHSDDADLDLQNLEVGESKTMTDDAGNDVTVTRTEKGLEFDIEGEKIEIMDIDQDGDVTVDIVKGGDHHDVTIISSKEISDETRTKIKEALGDEDVMFIDGSKMSGDEIVHEKHEVRIIKKKSDDATN